MIEKVNFSPLEPKGLIKVELFEDGKKVQELEDHNFISKGAQEVFKMRAKDLFTQKRAKNGGVISEVINDLFEQISLTDASHAEDPNNEWLRKGALLGYATSTESYSGGDSLRGAYNIAESETTTNRVRMVFDFPTHAGNGEIKSIYFHPSNAVYNISNTYSKFLGNPLGLSDIRSIKKHNNKIYVLRNDEFSVYDNAWELLNSYTLPDHNNVRDFEIVENAIYFASDSSSASVRKADLETPEQSTVVLTGFSYTCGITYNYDAKKIVVMDAKEEGALNYFDKDFNLSDTKTLNKLGFRYDYTPIFYMDNGIIVMNNFFFDETLKLYECFDFTNGGEPISSLVCCGVDDVNKDCIYLGANMLKVFKVSIGSRSLLATPITKTNKQTMKITYDFILE